MAAPDQDQRCPRCGTPYGNGQEYCLECGSRLPTRGGVIGRLGSAWRRRLGWYPGDWIWPTLFALLVAAAAGTASAFWLADRSSASDETVIAISPGASSVHETTTAPEPTVPPTETTLTTATTPPKPPPPPPPPRAARRVLAWPAGRSGWTIVLDSLPSPGGRSAAHAEARQALRAGLKRVGILDSSQFSSLHPGYFVVFAGVYGSQAEAQGALVDVHLRGYGSAYPRRITP
jgi:hypothetical protein